MRFKVLKEWIGTMPYGDVIPIAKSTGTGNTLTDISTRELWLCKNSRNFKYTKNVYIPIEFGPIPVGQNRAITQVRSNNIFLVGWSSTNDVIMTGRFRIRYTDG